MSTTRIPEPPGPARWWCWNGNDRSDGLAVRKLNDKEWRIDPSPVRGLAWEKCPCCDRAFDTAQGARFAADFLYPIRDA